MLKISKIPIELFSTLNYFIGDEQAKHHKT